MNKRAKTRMTTARTNNFFLFRNNLLCVSDVNLKSSYIVLNYTGKMESARLVAASESCESAN